MRKQIYCTVMVLLIVILNILSLSSCDEGEAVTHYGFTTEIENVTLDFDSTNYTTTVHTSTRISLHSEPAPETYAYTLTFLDGDGNALGEQTVTQHGGLSIYTPLSINETFENIVGKVESVRVVPYSMTVSNEAMEAESGEGDTFNFWYLIIAAAVIYFGYKFINS